MSPGLVKDISSRLVSVRQWADSVIRPIELTNSSHSEATWWSCPWLKGQEPNQKLTHLSHSGHFTASRRRLACSLAEPLIPPSSNRHHGGRRADLPSYGHERERKNKRERKKKGIGRGKSCSRVFLRESNLHLAISHELDCYQYHSRARSRLSYSKPSWLILGKTESAQKANNEILFTRDRSF